MIIPNILLDMDGVVCDLESHIGNLFGKTAQEVKNLRKPGEYYLSFEGVSEEEVWGAINSRGEAFWDTIPETEWARKLYLELCLIGNVYFLTTPSNDPYSLSGKLKWLYRFTGNSKFRNYLMGQPKFLCSGEKNVLIDDSDHNINLFEINGGKGILFPSINNSMHDFKGNPCNYVIQEVYEWLKIKEKR